MALLKLNQIVAIHKGVTSRAFEQFAKIDHLLAQKGLLKGQDRTYRPKADDGDELPPESEKLQIKVDDQLERARETLTRLFDVTATKEWANTSARADVVVDGEIIVVDAPVTYLLFLERQLEDIRTFVARLPTLPAGMNWHYDAAVDAQVSDPVVTTKTQKIPRNHVLSEATEKHIAQVHMYHEDVVIGYWTTIHRSGALPAERVKNMLLRVEELQRAVKFAREEANSVEVEDIHVARKIFDHILTDQ